MKKITVVVFQKYSFYDPLLKILYTKFHILGQIICCPLEWYNIYYCSMNNYEDLAFYF